MMMRGHRHHHPHRPHVATDSVADITRTTARRTRQPHQHRRQRPARSFGPGSEFPDCQPRASFAHLDIEHDQHDARARHRHPATISRINIDTITMFMRIAKSPYSARVRERRHHPLAAISAQLPHRRRTPLRLPRLTIALWIAVETSFFTPGASLSWWMRSARWSSNPHAAHRLPMTSNAARRRRVR